MALDDEIKALAERIPGLRPMLDDEAKTKQFLILPLIRALGYDDANPAEVVPEFVVDYDTSASWKIDYALMSNGEPLVVIECKRLSNQLEANEVNQLGRYFPNARRAGAQIAILTNGVIYKFFADKPNQQNIMDEKPFWTTNLELLRNNDLLQLRNFTKDNFNAANAVASASKFRHITEMKIALARQLTEPEDGFVEWMVRQTGQTYDRRVTSSRREEIRDLARTAFHEFVKDHVNDAVDDTLLEIRERAAQGIAPITEEQDALLQADSGDDIGDSGHADDKIITTEQELQAFDVVKGIAQEVVQAERVFMRDYRNYSAIMLDDNRRKPLCRLRLDGRQMQIGLFDGSRVGGHLVEQQHNIESLNDIYNHANQIRETARRYLES